MKEQYFEQLRVVEKEETVIREALRRGVEDVLPTYKGLENEMKDRRLKLYLGIDPTSPDLHIGHTVPLRKLRQFQDLGHEVVLLFGTFTGMIGDPTDKSAARVKMTPEQIDKNIATYAEQAGKILDLSDDAANPIQIAHNHEWLGKMDFAEVVDLMSNFTVDQMLKRSMFQKRQQDDKPIWLHELTYPLMQGWDAVAMGVDLEVGGKDQTFNMLVGRDLVGRYLDKEKWVMATQLIEDPDGKKMGKTEGNIVNIKSFPEWKYEAIMTWPDSAIPMGFELLTDVPLEEVYKAKELLNKNEVHPMKLKEALAYRVVSELDGHEAASYAEEEFDRVKRKGNLPRRIKEVQVQSGSELAEVMLQSNLVNDISSAKTKLAQRAVFVNGEIAKRDYVCKDDDLIQIGKKTIKNVRKVEVV